MNKIIPTDIFRGEHGEDLDLEAICFFMATGFFAENDTYWKGAKWEYLNFDEQPWKYKPRAISFDQAVQEFAEIFHSILKESVKDKKVILPLSGGLDSRSLAVGLNQIGVTPYTYSYKFEGSLNETKYGRQIASVYNWEYDEFIIESGYLWNTIEESASANGCYSEFTHARQAAVVKELSKKGDIWLLGHWGDVLFDDMNVSESLNQNEQIDVLYKKIVKKGGLELGKECWNSWRLNGDFEDYLRNKLTQMLDKIAIENVNARIRAFKSLYWATRWTSTNLHLFAEHNPMSIPYYDNRMCEFIMGIPEEYLADRRIQIAYIKKYAPRIAKIVWQEKSPYNLFTYGKKPKIVKRKNMILKKLGYMYKEYVLGQKLIERNWESQFLGVENSKNLKYWLYETSSFKDLIPVELVNDFYKRFEDGDKVYWSHPISMLLTLSVFCKQHKFLNPKA